MSNKNILYLGGFELPDKNAAAHRVMSNALTLRELGYKVTFIGPIKDLTNIHEEFNGFNIEYIDYPQSITQWIKYVITFISTEKILEYEPEYVILYNFPAISSLKILQACHKKGIKVIHDLTEWESSIGWSPREIIRKIDIGLRMRFCIKKMDGVIAISRYLYDCYCHYTKTIYVPPTVNLNNPKFDRGRNLSVNNPIQLVYAGNNNGGIKEKIDSIVNAVIKEDTLRLIVVGMSLEQYERIYGKLPKNSHNIIFKGRVSHHDAVKIVCSSDFQMLIRDNNLKNKAGFPTKFVESISCCTPVIATETSNVCDYLNNGKNGFIVNGQNSLSDVLRRVAQMTEEEIIRMKQACRDLGVFDYRVYIHEFSKLFYHE